MGNNYDKNINKKLFTFDFESNYSDDEVEKLSLIAKELIKTYGDKVVFNEWNDYLKESITDKKSARNFAYGFFQYSGHKFKVKDPYPFLALLFVKTEVSFDKEPDTVEEKEFCDLIDSIYVSLLTNAGIIRDDDYFYINYCSDDKLTKLINEIKISK